MLWHAKKHKNKISSNTSDEHAYIVYLLHENGINLDDADTDVLIITRFKMVDLKINPNMHKWIYKFR